MGAGSELSETLKDLLISIFMDDDFSIDQRRFDCKVADAIEKIDEIINSTGKLPNSCLSATPIILDGNEYNIEVDLSEIKLQVPSIQQFDYILKHYINDDIIARNFNVYNEVLNDFMKNALSILSTRISEYFLSLLPINQDFANEIKLKTMEIDIRVSKSIKDFEMCLKNCKSCGYVCTQLRTHSGSCNCGTNHNCILACEFCPKNSCSLPNGHEGRHVCKISVHICGKKCQVASECNEICTEEPRHNSSCKCSKKYHYCESKCSVCDKTCQEAIDDKHKVHNCKSKNCTYPCIFDDGHSCASTDHFHESSLKPILFKKKKVKLHLCGKEHACSFTCQHPGVCKCSYVAETTNYTNKHGNSFPYDYIRQTIEQGKCSKILPPDNIEHTGSHECTLMTFHYCVEKCPDCNTNCTRPYGHDGRCKSDAHKNKENCIYVGKEETFEKAREGSTYIVEAGETAKPLNCSSSCASRGRGHAHIIPCKSAWSCKQKTMPGLAMHSNEKYFSDKKNDHTKYDLVRCSQYWEILNWEPPVKNKSTQDTFDKCNYACNHHSHPHHDPVYCEDFLFHSNSTKFSDHTFPSCHHPTATKNCDIIFIIDSTGSMSTYIAAVKSTIESLIKSWSKKISTKFGVVSYTDHGRASGNYDSDFPVDFYPKSSVLNDSNESECIDYLNSIEESGGGGNGGEAMIDGISMATKFKCRPDSQRIYILVGDECPHGREFSENSTYPDGCICGIKWRDLMKFIKLSKIILIFVKLNECLNKTISLFQGELGESMKTTSLDQVGGTDVVNQFTEKVVSSVSAIIQTNFEFSLGLRD